ncbi:hypothetical protein IQ246_26715 [aff. Roholtiella sp. LEGE 12411]|nr:hypothetical protein [aff. Roholtiella sp. LEGE 12411]
MEETSGDWKSRLHKRSRIASRTEVRFNFKTAYTSNSHFSYSQSPMPNAQCPIPHSLFPMPNAPFPMPTIN